MEKPRKLISAADMDRMSPQERTDAVEAATARSWDEIDPAFRDEVNATARQLGSQRRGDA